MVDTSYQQIKRAKAYRQHLAVRLGKLKILLLYFLEIVSQVL
jgi:hypothetical protein